MIQQTLNFEPPRTFVRSNPNDITKRRHNGNAESADAFKRVNVSNGQRHVLDAMATLGRATRKDVAEYLGVPFNTISGRFSELLYDYNPPKLRAVKDANGKPLRREGGAVLEINK